MSESTLVKIPHCWKSHVTADIYSHLNQEGIDLSFYFRFFPIGLDVARIPQQNLVIGGYQIPAGVSMLMYGSHLEKILILLHANNKGADPPVHPGSLINNFICFLVNIYLNILIANIDILASLCS